MYKNQIYGLFIMLMVVTFLIIAINYQVQRTKDTLASNQIQMLNNQKTILIKLNETKFILTNLLNK